MRSSSSCVAWCSSSVRSPYSQCMCRDPPCAALMFAETTQTSSADSAWGGCSCYIVFLWACVLLDLGKSHGDEAYNASWRRHKPFICIHQIRGSHFIRRAVARYTLSPLCPPPDTLARSRSAPAWQLCQLQRAAVLTNTPGGLQEMIGGCVPSPPLWPPL